MTVGDTLIAGLREANLSRDRKVKVCLFPGAKIKNLYYLVPLLKKKLDNIILHFSTNDTEDTIYKELKCIKDFINNIHLAKKYISTNIWLHNKNANSILKRYVDIMKVLDRKSVILHDHIPSSHLNKDGLHFNSYGTIKLVENFILRIWMF